MSHSGAMSNDDNVAETDLDKHNEVIIDAQVLSCSAAGPTKNDLLRFERESGKFFAGRSADTFVFGQNKNLFS